MWLYPTVRNEHISGEEEEKLFNRMDATMEKIERVWLNNGKSRYIAEMDNITVADVQALCEMEQPKMAG